MVQKFNEFVIFLQICCLSLDQTFVFSPDDKDISIKHLLSDVKYAIMKLDPKIENNCVSKITNVITILFCNIIIVNIMLLMTSLMKLNLFLKNILKLL